MSNRIRALVAIGGAVLCCFAFASQAQSSQGIRSSANGPITASGTLTFDAGGLTGTCNSSLSITLLSNPIRKVRGGSIGRVTRASFSSCTGAFIAVPPVFLLDWTLRYTSFHGVLPQIAGIGVDSPDARFRLNTPVGLCLYQATLQDPLDGILFLVGNQGGVFGIRFLGDTVPLAQGQSALCPPLGRLIGLIALPGIPVVTLI